jgi:tripeptide aminopeptidase
MNNNPGVMFPNLSGKRGRRGWGTPGGTIGKKVLELPCTYEGYRVYLNHSQEKGHHLDTTLLLKTLRVQSYSRQTSRMNQFILAQCANLGVRTWVKDGNIYAVKGEASIYPCIVAHTDTVHTIKPKGEYRVVVSDDLIFAINPKRLDNAGVGGDDKVGICLALSCLETLPACKAVFFKDEEIGCIGSSVADMDFFIDCAFVLQGDRNGNSDFVQIGASTELFGDEFKAAVEPYLTTYGYKTYDWGSISDVIELKSKGLSIACANVSCGYYNPHSSREMVSIKDVASTLGLFLDICENLGDRQWFHVEPPMPTFRTTTGGTRYTGSRYSADAWGDEAYWTSDKRTSSPALALSDGKNVTAVGNIRELNDWSVRVQGKEYKSFDEYITKRQEVMQKYLDADIAEMQGEVESCDFTQEEIDDYLRGGSDSETEMGSIIDPPCPLCDRNDGMMWDTTEEEYFCMICQLYEGEAGKLAKRNLTGNERVRVLIPAMGD